MRYRGLPFFILGMIASPLWAGEALPVLSPLDKNSSGLEFLDWKLASAKENEQIPFRPASSRRPAQSLTQNSPIFPELLIPGRRVQQLEKYRQSLSQNKTDACDALEQLRHEEDFPLRLLAQNRFWIRCPERVDVNEQLPESQPSFLSELKTEAEMSVSEQNAHWDIYLSHLYLKTRSMKLLREKTKNLELGLALAEKKKRPDEIHAFRNELERLAPRFIEHPRPEQFLEVGQDWVRVREFEKGRSYFRRVLGAKTSPLPQQRRAFQSLRNSYKVEQDRKTHLVEAEKFYRWLARGKDKSLTFDAGLYWVRALWTEGQRDKAEAEMKKLERDFASLGKLYEIEHIRGRMAEEDGHYEKALTFYDHAIRKGGMGSNQEIKIESAKAWALRRLGRPLEAAQEYARIASQSPDLPEKLRARFWQAKSLTQAGQTDEAKKIFRQVAYEDPVGYYGLVSFRELGVAIPPLSESREKSLAGWNVPAETLMTETEASGETTEEPSLTAREKQAATPPATPQALRPSRLLNIEEKDWIHNLYAAGEKQLLQKYLDHLAADGNWNWTNGDGLHFLKAYAHAGLYLPLFANIGKMETAQREQLLLAHPELLFPQDFSELIAGAAEREKIPKELIFSIIRQESAFDPNARSFADAMGLMQVLPDPAKRLAKGLGLSFSGHDDLFTPAFNVPVGAHMLRQGLDRYQGNFILAIASYNANDRAIRNWLKTRFRDDPVEFIEEIAYEETRGYVKLVLRNYIFYKRLSNPNLALSFPSECLPDLHNFKHSEPKEIVSR